jgi:hypothetical protein
MQTHKKYNGSLDFGAHLFSFLTRNIASPSIFSNLGDIVVAHTKKCSSKSATMACLTLFCPKLQTDKSM